MLGVIEHMGLKLFGCEIIFEEFKPIWTRYLNVTDRQTDRQTDGQTDGRLTVALPRSALASRGKKTKGVYSNIAASWFRLQSATSRYDFSFDGISTLYDDFETMMVVSTSKTSLVHILSKKIVATKININLQKWLFQIGWIIIMDNYY